MDSIVASPSLPVQINGIYSEETPGPSLEDIEKELPVVYDGQIPLGDLLSRVVQSIYAELSEQAETLPNMSDSARKRVLADWVVKTKKQVVKLYVVAKWSRDADAVQKCMNITAFLLTQNQQFEDAIKGLNSAKDRLNGARYRNHDLLTSLDVLTKGSYLRLPTCIKKMAIPPTPLTDTEVNKTLSDMEETIQYRLRMAELIPVEMSNYHIAGGRVHFTVPNLFSTSLCLQGAEKHSGWFCTNVEFLINVGGDLTGLQEFPRRPVGIVRQHITDEADNRLGCYLERATSEMPPEILQRPRLPPGVIDTPLVRLYNFLRPWIEVELEMMSLSYQLEILWYQAERMRSLGWGDYLNIQMSPDRKGLRASYWMRSTIAGRNRPKTAIPILGGTFTVSILEAHAPAQSGSGPARSSRQRIAARLQQKSKLGAARPSDEVEGFEFSVQWEPTKGALGVLIPPNEYSLPEGTLEIDAGNLDFERILRTALRQHANAILRTFRNQLQNGPNKVFSRPGVVTLVLEENVQTLRVQLCEEEVVIITIDIRTGKLKLRDTGDLAAAGRGPRFVTLTDRLNDNPGAIFEALFHLRGTTIVELAEQKANYLGLQNYRHRNIPGEEMAKLGPEYRWTLFIQLVNFPDHYLVLVVAEERFKYALITTKTIPGAAFASMVMEDIAWLDFDRIREAGLPSRPDHNQRPDTKSGEDEDKPQVGMHPNPELSSRFNLDTQGLKELYRYCCARVAFINVERQFKIRGIPFTHVNPANNTPLTPEYSRMQSSLARSVPVLCVQSEHILSGAPAAEAAMPNIRVIPLNWWSDEKAQVVTCVKLKYVQQPIGKKASGSAVIRPSKRIIYDTREAVVSFLSENVNTCVDEFLEEWARVSKMVVIAREVAQMSKRPQWQGVRLLSFDLQTVEFAYAQNYTVSITCEDQLSPTGGTFDLDFSRTKPEDAMDEDAEFDTFNPHEDAEPYLRDILRHAHRRLAPSLHYLVAMLRSTLSIVVELQKIRRSCRQSGEHVEIFAKAAGWYRLQYPDHKYALDFRLNNVKKILILDASHSLFSVGKSIPSDPLVDKSVFQPIPRFREIISGTVGEGLSSRNLEKGEVVNIDVGVICNGEGVGVLTPAIHAELLKGLSR